MISFESQRKEAGAVRKPRELIRCAARFPNPLPYFDGKPPPSIKSRDNSPIPLNQEQSVIFLPARDSQKMYDTIRYDNFIYTRYFHQ